MPEPSAKAACSADSGEHREVKLSGSGYDMAQRHLGPGMRPQWRFRPGGLFWSNCRHWVDSGLYLYISFFLLK